MNYLTLNLKTARVKLHRHYHLHVHHHNNKVQTSRFHEKQIYFDPLFLKIFHKRKKQRKEHKNLVSKADERRRNKD
jgi:hypothetical protein